MKRHTGNPEVPIWLIGDSEPTNWSEKLREPLDSRHPARHNIWSPILLQLNANLYRMRGRILDIDKLYVRNAVGNISNKPAPSAIQWQKDTRRSISWLRQTLKTKKPFMIFTFGSFAFEFLRRAVGGHEPKPFQHWSTSELSASFQAAIQEFKLTDTNVFPLLHVSIARRYFLSSHAQFTGTGTGNYFAFVANCLTEKLLLVPDKHSIWAKPGKY